MPEKIEIHLTGSESKHGLVAVYHADPDANLPEITIVISEEFIDRANRLMLTDDDTHIQITLNAAYGPRSDVILYIGKNGRATHSSSDEVGRG